MIDRLFALETFGVKLGLDNISHLCAALGHPERAFTALHVAGTNGKGSVTAMAHAALMKAGLRAARYTSPHLSNLRERFVVGNGPVDDAVLEAVADDVLDCAYNLRETGTLAALPTFFEAATAIAFELFRRESVQVAVIEVGLGGRFDATNVLMPATGVITSIGLDHQEFLGDTLAAIAYEKAGIIKAGMTVVTGAVPGEAGAVIERVARERGATIVPASSGTRVASEADAGRTIVTIDTPDDSYGPVTLALRGDHQIGNALVTVRLLEAARSAGLPIPKDAIVSGLASAVWPARLELLSTRDGRQLLLDAAHNADGAHALATYLRRWHPERPPLVFGVMRDKDVESMLRMLLPVTGPVTATAADTSRALPAEALARQILEIDPERTVCIDPSPVHAVETALRNEPLVCVAGSIFLAGEVRGAFEPRAILL